MYKMKTLRIILVFTLLFGTIAAAQTRSSCVHCNMYIKDQRFEAQAENSTGTLLKFDAIECLVNYIKQEGDMDFQSLWVTDYKQETLVNATKAYYLKSKGVKSPMGANLSAYIMEEEAKKMQQEFDGEVLSWTELRTSFEEIGALQTEGAHNHHRPDAYAPGGIMGDHLHPKGGTMISFRTMQMSMNGNRSGSSEVSDNQVYEQYMVAPQDMYMQMYMLGAMYAPSNKITLMAMQNLVLKDMDLVARMMMDNGMQMLNNFSTSSSGLGDMKLGALLGIYEGESHTLHLNTSLSIPLGSIDQRGDTPMMSNARLPYAMQLGTGTWDVTLGGTLRGTYPNFSWGVQQLNTLRTGNNRENYSFGNQYELHSWVAHAISGYSSVSLRLSACKQDRLKGADDNLNPMMVPTADPDNYGGEYVHAAAGINVLLAKDQLVIGGEVAMPVYQHYNGIAMNQDLAINATLRYTVF